MLSEATFDQLVELPGAGIFKIEGGNRRGSYWVLAM